MSRYMLRGPDGAVDGPFTSDELKTLAYEGRITSESSISPLGESRWVAANRVGGLREILAQLAPPEPSERLPAPYPEEPVDEALTPEPAPGEPASSVPIPLEERPDSPFQHRSPTSSIFSPADSSRSKPHSARSPRAVPQYGMLRFVSSWFSSFGWVILFLAFFLALITTVAGIPGAPLEWGVIVSLALGALAMEYMRRAANRSPNAGWIGAIVFLPLIPWSIRAANATSVPQALRIQMLTQPAAIVGGLLAMVITAMLLIALAEYFIAHADIASNSWRQEPDDL